MFKEKCKRYLGTQKSNLIHRFFSNIKIKTYKLLFYQDSNFINTDGHYCLNVSNSFLSFFSYSFFSINFSVFYILIIFLFAREYSDISHNRHARRTIKAEELWSGTMVKGPVARVKWSPRCRNYRGNKMTANNTTNTA